MKYIVIAFLILAACKKEDVKTTQEVKTYLLTHSTNAAYRDVKVNGTTVTLPVNVKTGDVVTVKYVTQTTTPQNYDLQVSVYLDGNRLGGCNQCYEYINTFNI